MARGKQGRIGKERDEGMTMKREEGKIDGKNDRRQKNKGKKKKKVELEEGENTIKDMRIEE